MAYCHCVRFYLLYTVAMFSAVPVLMASSTDESKKAYAKEIIGISGNGSAATASGTDYENWVLNAPLPLESSKIQKQLRLRRRSLYKEKVPKYLVASTSPYSSLVYVSIGCIGTFISPVHVLTAAHCVHDGVRIRQGPMMNRLKIGMLRRNGKQHKIRVKKIFVSPEIKPTTESRFAYDYAVLKLARPHRKPYLQIKAVKGMVRSLKFHVFEKNYKRRISMYKYSHCHVINNYGLNFFKVHARDCPSASGDSGAAVFESSEESNTVIGLVSATAMYKSGSRGYTYNTVILRLTDFDVARIKKWISR